MLKELAKEIKDGRASKNLTVMELANLVSFSPTYVSMIENGHLSPTAHVLRKLCETLELDYDKCIKMTLQYKKFMG